jgi:hypothetical protein
LSLDFDRKYQKGSLVLSTKLEGADEIIKLFNSIGGVVKEAGVDALTAVEETIMSESFPEVPKKDGGLEGSAFANDVVIVGDIESIEFGYNIIYAVRQHEELDWVHPIKGKAKYLEDPANRVAPSIPGIFKEYLDPAIKKAAQEADR